eukprot:gnl/Spiro4/13380_TR7126_c0_g1_i1.p1 gnl/Spiro4/13380_TR7126_c0_g1~~gnl/Spiro4/13380_TR7126_c0_g1_i1.p1  ORF type:complete len:267 (-),score=53.05 gnl/Spiro4/13380_TR7126_c0_g1_i1:141-899(-)
MTSPPSVITASYLDSRRYRHYLAIWSILSVFLGLQKVQQLWMNMKQWVWSAFIARWRKTITGADRPPEPVVWEPVKQDFFAPSVHSFLEDFANGVHPPRPLVALGRSFVVRPNIVHVSHPLITHDDADLLLTHNCEVGIEPSAAPFAALLAERYPVLECCRAPWRSRFLACPPRASLPSRDELAALSPEDLESGGFSGDAPVKHGEFDPYEFEQFLSRADTGARPDLNSVGAMIHSEKMAILRQVVARVDHS